MDSPDFHDLVDAAGRRIYGLLRPTWLVVALFGFFILFPEFMDLIVPENPGGYAGGTVTADGEVVNRYEGGTAPQYQWWYPIVLPFMIVWYFAVVSFDLLEVLLGLPAGWYPVASTVYFYLLAAVIAPGLERGWRATEGVRRRVRTAVASR